MTTPGEADMPLMISIGCDSDVGDLTQVPRGRFLTGESAFGGVGPQAGSADGGPEPESTLTHVNPRQTLG